MLSAAEAESIPTQSDIARPPGLRDRVVPIGERVAAWVVRHVRVAGLDVVVGPGQGYRFRSADSDPIAAETLSLSIGRYVRASGVARTGSCHLSRTAGRR